MCTGEGRGREGSGECFDSCAQVRGGEGRREGRGSVWIHVHR